MGAEQIGAGPDLVLLHSLLTDRRVYDRVLPPLAGRFRVTIVDLPGFGDSDLVPGGIGNYADAMASLLDAVGVAPPTAVIGNGLGSFVAVGMAIQHPELVGKLVLVGAAARFPESARGAFDVMAERASNGGMAAVTEVAVARIFADEYAREHPDMVEERRRALLGMNVEGFVAGCRTIRDVDFTSELAAVIAPTLVVVGSDDRATLPSYGRELAVGIRGARYLELPGVAHGPQLQAPGQFLDAIGPFLVIG
jgi:pimeloyl-ACP methyl ester carboxylesterase